MTDYPVYFHTNIYYFNRNLGHFEYSAGLIQISHDNKTFACVASKKVHKLFLSKDVVVVLVSQDNKIGVLNFVFNSIKNILFEKINDSDD